MRRRPPPESQRREHLRQKQPHCMEALGPETERKLVSPELIELGLCQAGQGLAEGVSVGLGGTETSF